MSEALCNHNVYLPFNISECITFEFTGLRSFSRRSGEMIG